MNEERHFDTFKCTWQGYLGGANYEDAGCAEGKIVDLDTCDEPGGPCVFTGDQCPNCHGKGRVLKSAVRLGPMALIRQRARLELEDQLHTLAELPEEGERLEMMTELLTSYVQPMFELIDKLEAEKEER